MFQHSYQSGAYLEVFHTKTDKEKDKSYEKLYRVVNAAGFKKVYDKITKGFIYELDGMRTSLHFPNSEKQDLGLIQPYLVLQVFLPQGSPFSVEITITDTLKNKRRLHFNTCVKQLEKTYFHAKVPLDILKRGVWLNLSFDIISFFELFKGQTFRSIDAFTVGAVCKLRRIYTMRSPIADFSAEDDMIGLQTESKIVPKTQNFPPGVNYTNQLVTLDLIKSQGATAGMQAEESILEDSTVPQGVKTKALPLTKQPLGLVNTKKDSNQPQLKAKAVSNKDKSAKLQEDTGKIDVSSRGKENIRENVALISSDKRKGGNIIPKKNVVGLNTKPSSIENTEFHDEKIYKNVPKPYKKEEQSSRLIETALIQEEPEHFSPESSQVSSRNDYEEQKRVDTNNLGGSISEKTRSSGTKSAVTNPWGSYKDSSLAKSKGKVNSKENTVSSLSMDTRKDFENTNTGVSTRIDDTKRSGAQSTANNDEMTPSQEDIEFANIWQRVMGQDNGAISGKKSQEGSAFKAKEQEFSPLGEREEEINDNEEEEEEDREREEKEKERFGTMNWEFTRKNFEEEDEIESVEEDLAFEIEEKIAMRDDREELGTQWKRQEFKAKEREGTNEEKEERNVQINKERGVAEGDSTQKSAQETIHNTGKSIWETNQRRSLSEFELKWKDQEHNKDGNSLVIQEDGSGEEDALEDSLEVMVNEYVNKLEKDEKDTTENVKKRNTKRALSQIEDQVQDMVSRVRPYSPPFGQTLTSSDGDKEGGKWCLEGVKTMKSSSEEEDDKVEHKEEMEVVYDPVWKCYYDPKTNSYFELK